MELEVRGDFGDSDKAESVAKEANDAFSQAKPFLTAMAGLPSGIVDSVEIDSKGDAVVIEAEASKEDMEKLAKMAEEQRAKGGGMGLGF